MKHDSGIREFLTFNIRFSRCYAAAALEVNIFLF